MRKIRIDKVSIPDLTSHYIKQRMYSVSLGNGSTVWFSNEKQAYAHLADVNRVLNQVLHELNYIYGNAYMTYRTNWGYFYGTRKKDERIIKNTMSVIDRTFNLAVERCRSENGNHFTFTHLFNIINELESILTMLLELLTKRKNYAEVHKMDVYLNMLKYQRNELNQVGKKVEIEVE